MRNAIEVGSILIERGALMPDSWLPPGGPCSSGWISVRKPDRSELEARIHEAGWTFFYLAGEIKATVFGFDKRRTLRKAVKRLFTTVKAQRLNCLEITRVTMSSFLGVPYATVAGYPRHIQAGMVLLRATTLPDKAGSPPVVLSSGIRRQRSGSTEEPLLAEEAVAAWEAEGGAPGNMGSRQGADAKAELSDEDLEFKEVLV